MKTTIDPPSEQVAALEAQAAREARPTADIVRDALDRYLADRRDPLPPGAGIFAYREAAADDPDRHGTGSGRPRPQAIGMHADDEGNHTHVEETPDGRRRRLPPGAGIYEDDEVTSANLDDWLRAN